MLYIEHKKTIQTKNIILISSRLLNKRGFSVNMNLVKVKLFQEWFFLVTKPKIITLLNSKIVKENKIYNPKASFYLIIQRTPIQS